MLLEPLVLQRFQKQRLILHLSADISKNNVTKTNVFATFPKQLVILHLTVDMFKNNVAKTIVCNNYMTTETNVAKTIGFTIVQQNKLLTRLGFTFFFRYNI